LLRPTLPRDRSRTTPKRLPATLRRPLLISSLPMFDIIRDAGWPIWPLLAVSFVALALIVERFLALRRSRVLPADMLSHALSLAIRPQLGTDVLAQLEAQAPLGRVLAAGLRHRHLERPEIVAAMEDAGRVSAHELH